MSCIRTGLHPAAALLLAGAVLVGCDRAERGAPGPPEKVVVAFATPPYTTLADVAQAKGFFREQGLEVAPVFHSRGKAALDDVLQGKADFATVAETPLMFAILRGEQPAILATIQTSNRSNALVARKDRGILTPRDLKGRRIAAPSGTSGEFFLDAFLVTHGIPEEEVTIVDLLPEKMPKALADGTIDAASTFWPFLGEAQLALGGNGIAFFGEEIYTATFNLAARRDYVRRSAGTIRKMLGALAKAEEFVASHPQEAIDGIAAFRRMDRRLIDDSFTGNNFALQLDQSLVLALEDESRWAIDRGLTDARRIPNFLDFIDLDALASVKPQAVSILR